MNITIVADGPDYGLSIDKCLGTPMANIIILHATPENIDDLLAQIRAAVINNIPAKQITDNG